MTSFVLLQVISFIVCGIPRVKRLCDQMSYLDVLPIFEPCFIDFITRWVSILTASDSRRDEIGKTNGFFLVFFCRRVSLHRGV